MSVNKRKGNAWHHDLVRSYKKTSVREDGGGAGDAIRTRDILLGKEMLYH